MPGNLKGAWRWSWVALFAGCVACSPAGRQESTGIPALPELDRTAFSGEILAQVERAYEHAKSQPASAAASGLLGMTLQAYGQSEAALMAYQRALALAPGEPRWRYYEARALELLGQYEAAIASYKSALELDPDYLPTRIRVADLLLRAGRLKEAGAIYEALAADHPNSAAAHFGLGRLLSEQGAYGDAITHLRRACELAPSYPPARYALAIAMRKAGETAAAERELALHRTLEGADSALLEDPLFDEVTALKSESSLHHIEKGRQLETAGSFAEAAAAYRRALEINPHSVQAHVNLLSVHGAMGDYQLAEQHYRNALSIRADVEELYYNYGNLMALQGRAREAVTAYEKALSLNPGSSESHNNLGYVLETMGRRDEAIAHYKEALRGTPDHRLAHYHLGRNLMARGDHAKAVVHLEQAAKLVDEKTPRILYELTRAYLALGNREAASRSADQARRQAAALGQNEVVTLLDRELGRR